MSWFDTLAPILLDVGTQVIGSNITKDANNRATQQAIEASQRALAAQQEANQQAQAQYTLEQQALTNLQGTAATAVARTNELIARNPGLTPAQQNAVDEASRQTSNMLAGGGLAGDGRAMVAGVGKVAGDMRANFIDTNQRTSDAAATGLAGQYYNAGTAAAGVRDKMAQTAVQGGQNQATAIDAVGKNEANLTTNNAQTSNRAINDISGYIASDLKNNALNQRTGQYTGPRTQQPQTAPAQSSRMSFGGN